MFKYVIKMNLLHSPRQELRIKQCMKLVLRVSLIQRFSTLWLKKNNEAKLESLHAMIV